MKEKIVYIVFLFIVIFGCNDDENLEFTPGTFMLTEIKTPTEKSSLIPDVDSIKNKFILGDVKASKEFFYLLTNVGDSPIYDVTLESDNANFTLSPLGIGYLPGKNSESGTSFLQLINLAVIHGKQLNGVGTANLLPMGINTSLLTIKGKTIDKGDTVKIESNFIFELNAKVMDIKLFDNGNEINLLNPCGAITPQDVGEIVRYYCIYAQDVKSTNLEISNLGNVDIDVTTNSGDYTDNFLLPQGQTTNINLPEFGLPFFSVISLNGNGTVTDYSRIRLGNDGVGYFGISLNPPITEN